jgi:protein-tyrosine phosphatase
VAPEVMRPLLEVRGDYLDASVSAIEASHGSVERYLDEALGVDVARLRDHYLEAA